MGQSVVTGTWSGILDVGSARLPMKLTIGEDGVATLYSLDQGGKPIPGRMSAERVEIVHGLCRCGSHQCRRDRALACRALKRPRTKPRVCDEAALSNQPSPRAQMPYAIMRGKSDVVDSIAVRRPAARHRECRESSRRRALRFPVLPRPRFAQREGQKRTPERLSR
jgi:hypothetical protein